MHEKMLLKLEQDHRQMDRMAYRLITFAQREFVARNITAKDFSMMMDLLTCLNLKTQEASLDINHHLHINRRKIDLRI